MVKVYAVALALGFIALIVVVMGGALAENLGRTDPGERIGPSGRAVIGAVTGFGIGGMGAEFSPLDFSWQVAFLIAVLAAALGIGWVRYSDRRGVES
ncbi:MAG: hypothetical protein DWQ40_10105 [Actinobacteria bacterium]|nr:MAG: hypothetical protein DWQ40_10105 [Actinomycetota bacterium]